MSAAVKTQLVKVVANIRKVRYFRNYSQEYVASKVGMSQHGYSKIENGMSALSVERLYTIAEALEVTVGDLIDLDMSSLKPVPLSRMTHA